MTKTFYMIIYIDSRFGVLQHWELFETEESAHAAATEMNIDNMFYKVVSIDTHPTMPEHFTICCG